MIHTSIGYIVLAMVLALFGFSNTHLGGWFEAIRIAFFPLIVVGVFCFWKGFK